MLNERIERFDSPFRRLDALLAGIVPNPRLAPIVMSVGEPQDAPPSLLAAAIATSPYGSVRKTDWHSRSVSGATSH